MTINSTPNPSEIYDLVIVGCGPTGLLAAHGAFKRGCQRILLLERAREFEKVGRGLQLQPNAVRAMKMIAPKTSKKLEEASFRMDTSEEIPVYSYDGSLKYNLTAKDGDDKGSAYRWWEVQHALLEDLDDTIEVKNDAFVTKLDHYPEHVRITYMTNRPRSSANENGGNGDPTHPSEDHSVYGRVVIASDGIRSRCRQEIYRAIGGDKIVPYAHPVYTGIMKVDVHVDITSTCKATVDAYKELWEILPSGIADPGASDASARLPKMTVLGASDASARLPNMLVIPIPENKVWFMCFASMAQSLASQPEECLSELAAIVDSEVEIEPLRIMMKAFASDVGTGDIRVVAEPLMVAPIFPFDGFDTERPPELPRPFAYKRVFMAGDALHGCPPLMAMGAAMGFEDVCELIDLLADTFKWKEGAVVDVSDDELGVVAERYRNARTERLLAVVGESAFPKLRTDKSVYLPWRAKLFNFKPVALGWSKLNKPDDGV